MAEYLKQKNESVSWKIKMVEITSEEQNKVKRMKRTEDSLRPLGQYQTHKHLNYKGPRRRREEKKGMKKFLKRL